MIAWKCLVKDNVVSKVMPRNLAVTKRMALPCSVMCQLLHSIIYPHLLYAIQVWGNTFDCHPNKIVLQKKAIRMMTLNNTTSTTGHLSPSTPLYSDCPKAIEQRSF